MVEIEMLENINLKRFKKSGIGLITIALLSIYVLDQFGIIPPGYLPNNWPFAAFFGLIFILWEAIHEIKSDIENTIEIAEAEINSSNLRSIQGEKKIFNRAFELLSNAEKRVWVLSNIPPLDKKYFEKIEEFKKSRATSLERFAKPTFFNFPWLVELALDSNIDLFVSKSLSEYPMNIICVDKRESLLSWEATGEVRESDIGIYAQGKTAEELAYYIEKDFDYLKVSSKNIQELVDMINDDFTERDLKSLKLVIKNFKEYYTEEQWNEVLKVLHKIELPKEVEEIYNSTINRFN